ncbi:MAG: trimeric intracellular cation channel family protein [Polymorphobacter sp.]
MRPVRDHLLTVVDLGSVLLFAVEGALAAVAADLDLFGILVLAFVGSVGGGIVRDLILGERPPAAFRDWRYAALAVAAVGIVLIMSLASGGVARWTPPLLVTLLDAGALALAAVAGARKAMDYGLNMPSVVMLAVLTGCGGGTLRDVLLVRVPNILKADFYATAALAGGVVLVVLVRGLRVSPPLAGFAAGALVFSLRALAVLQSWSLPHLH